MTRNPRAFDEIIQRVAHQNNTTTEEVRHEMNACIQQAFADADKDTSRASAQGTTRFQGKIPTIEEFIQYAVDELVTTE